MVSGEDRELAREIASYQEELKNPSISVERRKGLEKQVQHCNL